MIGMVSISGNPQLGNWGFIHPSRQYFSEHDWELDEQ